MHRVKRVREFGRQNDDREVCWFHRIVQVLAAAIACEHRFAFRPAAFRVRVAPLREMSETGSFPAEAVAKPKVGNGIEFWIPARRTIELSDLTWMAVVLLAGIRALFP